MTRETARFNYDNAKYKELWQCYGRCSNAKYKAMEYCKRLQHEKRGYDGRITSFNTFQFSYAFQFVEPDTGAIKLMYITKAHDREFYY